MAEIDKAQAVRTLLEAYGVGVRAGVLTPCLQDENEFRKMLRLPEAPPEVVEDWQSSNGIRRPITLAKPSITDEQIDPGEPGAEEAEPAPAETEAEKAEAEESESFFKDESKNTLPKRPVRKAKK